MPKFYHVRLFGWQGEFWIANGRLNFIGRNRTETRIASLHGLRFRYLNFDTGMVTEIQPFNVVTSTIPHE